MQLHDSKFWLIILWLGVFPALLFLPVWLAGNVYGTFDLAHLNIALEDVFARYQRAGAVPVWAPEFHGGYPLLSTAFQSFFYLPHVLLRQFLPGVWVMNLSLLLHLWLAVAGMYALLRLEKLPRVAAIGGALVFALGGYFVGRVTLPHLFLPATWLPLVIWSVQRAWREPSWRRVGLVAVIYAAQIFAGHIQMAIYTGLTIALVGIIELLRAPVRGWYRRWLFLLLPVAVLMLSAVHVLPARELIRQSSRGTELTGSEAFDVGYPLAHLKTWIQPHAFGHQAEYRGAKNEPELMTYFGWSGLLLGIIGIFSLRTWRSPLGQVSIVLVIIGFLLATGGYSLVYRWLFDHVGLVARLANPGRAIVLVHLGWSILAALGMATVASKIRVKTRRVALYTVLIVIGFELLVAARPVIPTLPREVWGMPRVLAYLPVSVRAPRIFSHTRIEPAVQTDFNPEVGPLLTKHGSLRQTVEPQQDTWSGVHVMLTWNGREPQEGAVTLTLEREGRFVRAIEVPGKQILPDQPTVFTWEPAENISGGQYTLVLTSTYAAAQAPRVRIRTNRGEENYNPTGELTQCHIDTCQTLTAPDWKSPADLDFSLRYQSEDVFLPRELLSPLFGEAAGQQMVRAHLALQIDRVHQYLLELGERANFDPQALRAARDLLDRFSVGIIMASFEEHRSLRGLEAVELMAKVPAGDNLIHIYRNNQAYPRFHVTQQVVLVGDGQQARAALKVGIPREAVAVEGLSSAEIPAGLASTDAQVELLQDEDREVVLAVESSSPQFLVLRDVMYSGWQATIDEQRVPIFLVDSVFRGVMVPAGCHTISYTFESRPVRRGGTLSLVAWAAVLAGFGVYLKRVWSVSRPYRTEAEKEAEEDSFA